MCGYFRGSERKPSRLQPQGRDFLFAGAGVFFYPPDFSFPAPRCALRKARKVDMESNIPPMLAAQSAFRSEPLPSFHSIFDQLIWR
jgi:hypothetical protein